ncbi:hypothetical protein F5Y18DRAFT_431242 [Xylariaceae sp. FL1019]|nr:hypothetical protein F5Y18DRAFT_431242 [Xylariaceae sp. FL1019]
MAGSTHQTNMTNPINSRVRLQMKCKGERPEAGKYDCKVKCTNPALSSSQLCPDQQGGKTAGVEGSFTSSEYNQASAIGLEDDMLPVKCSDGTIDLTLDDDMTTSDDRQSDMDDISSNADHEISEIIDLTENVGDEITGVEQGGRVEDIPMGDETDENTELARDGEAELTSRQTGNTSNDTNQVQAPLKCCKPNCSNPPARGLNKCCKCLNRAAQEWKASIQKPPTPSHCSLSDCLETPAPGQKLCPEHNQPGRRDARPGAQKQTKALHKSRILSNVIRQRVKDNAPETTCSRNRCWRKATPDRRLCEKHWRSQQRDIARRPHKKANDVCIKCGVPSATSKCQRCRDVQRASDRAYKKRRNVKGVCDTCGKPCGPGKTKCGKCSGECYRSRCSKPRYDGHMDCAFHLADRRLWFLKNKCKVSCEGYLLSVTMSKFHVSLAITPKPAQSDEDASADYAATGSTVGRCTSPGGRCEEPASAGYTQCTYHRAWQRLRDLNSEAAIQKASLTMTTGYLPGRRGRNIDILTVAIVPKENEVKDGADVDTVMDGSNDQSQSEDDEMSDLLGSDEDNISIYEHTADVG